MSVLELRAFAFDDLVLETVAGPVLLDEIEETLRKIVRMDVDGVVRELAQRPLFRILPRPGSSTP
jgi:hypothetical protein